MPSIHQIIIGASRRDAITNMALSLQDALLEIGDSQIYAYFGPDHTVEGEIFNLTQLPDGTSEDVLVYHSSFGIPKVTELLLHRPEKLVVVYHNITPSELYEEIDPVFAEGLKWGREELQLLKKRVERVFAVSNYNANDLSKYGYEQITVIPAGLVPKRLNEFPTNKNFLGIVRRQFPGGYLLVVSQVLQHKRVELAIQTVHLLRSVWRLDIGLVVAGPLRKPSYHRDLVKLCRHLPEAKVSFTDEIDESQLATLYRDCLLYLGTSEHEGLAIPPLEAMAAGTPVLVRDSGAMAETVKDAACLLPNDCSVGEIAGAAARIISDRNFRIELISRGFQRIKEFENQDTSSLFVKEIEQLLL